MKKTFLLLLLSWFIAQNITAYPDTKKISAAQKFMPSLPDSFFEQINSVNGVDLVFFYSGKSMEFNDKNAVLPISMISKEKVSNIIGYKHIGLFTYKINGSLLIESDILFNETKGDILLKFKTRNKLVYYQKMTEDGKKILRQWINQ
jgi:hypothetical protein